MQNIAGVNKHRREAIDQEATRVNDTGMHKSGNRRWPVHGIGQPVVQEKLGGPCKRGQGKKYRRSLECCHSHEARYIRTTVNPGKQFRQRPRTVGVVQDGRRDNERHVTNAVGDEGPERIPKRTLPAHVVAEQEIK